MKKYDIQKKKHLNINESGVELSTTAFRMQNLNRNRRFAKSYWVHEYLDDVLRSETV